MFADIRARFLTLTPLGLTVSNPPAQADVQALADKSEFRLAAGESFG